MADVPHEAPHHLAGKGLKKLPKWAWPVIIGVVIIGALWYRHQQNLAAAQAAANTQNAGTNPNDPNAAQNGAGYDPNANGYGYNQTGGWLPSGTGGSYPYPQQPASISIVTGGGPPHRPNTHHHHKHKHKPVIGGHPGRHPGHRTKGPFDTGPVMRRDHLSRSDRRQLTNPTVHNPPAL